MPSKCIQHSSKRVTRWWNWLLCFDFLFSLLRHLLSDPMRGSIPRTINTSGQIFAVLPVEYYIPICRYVSNGGPSQINKIQIDFILVSRRVGHSISFLLWPQIFVCFAPTKKKYFDFDLFFFFVEWFARKTEVFLQVGNAMPRQSTLMTSRADRLLHSNNFIIISVGQLNTFQTFAGSGTPNSIRHRRHFCAGRNNE